MKGFLAVALVLSTALQAHSQGQDETFSLKESYAKGQKFTVTAEMEFVGDADFAPIFGNAKLKASFDAVIDGNEKGVLTSTFSFHELSGKGNVKVDEKRWSYDLLWKTGSNFRKTVISHLPLDETEKAVGDLEKVFKAKWTAKAKPMEATLEGKTESLSFLTAWMPNLFVLPGPVPFLEKKLRKGDRFEEGGILWTLQEIKSPKAGVSIAQLAGKTKEDIEPRKQFSLAFDSRGFIASLRVEHFEKGAEKPFFRLEGLVERQ